MKRLIKGIIALLLLALTAGTVLVLSLVIRIPKLSPWFIQLYFNHSWVLTGVQVMLLILAGLLVLALLVTLLVSSQRKHLVFDGPHGKIEVPRSTLVKIAEDAYSKVINPDKVKMKLKIVGKEKLAVHLTVHVLSKTRYESVALDIQQAVKNALDEALETAQTEVIVQLKEVEATNTSKIKKSHSRVV